MSPEETEKDQFNSPGKFAPEYALPDRELFVIEYPGVIKDFDKALASLGGQKTISRLYNEEGLWELKPRPGNPFSHPIIGHVVNTRNLVLRVTRRVRRRKKTLEEVYVAMHCTVVGLCNKTVRFRVMCDFQYQPQGPLLGEYRQLMSAIQNMDIEKLSNPSLPAIRDDCLSLLPPPVFSMNKTPFPYKYAQSYGLSKKLAKQDRSAPSYKISYQIHAEQKGPTFEHLSWSFTDPQVPTTPLPEYLQAQLPTDLLTKMRALFTERPIWTRLAINHALDSPNEKLMRQLLRIFAYRIDSGPWHDSWARLGYDPRIDPESRRYQVLGFRKSPLQVDDLSFSQSSLPSASQRPYIFTPHSPPASHLYSICDVQYSRIDKYVNDTAHLLDEPRLPYGWFHKAVYRRIHSIVFDKYQSLLDKLRAQRSHQTGVAGAPLAWSRFNIVPLRRRTKESDDNMSDTDIETLISNEQTLLVAPDSRNHTAAYPIPSISSIPGSGHDAGPAETSVLSASSMCDQLIYDDFQLDEICEDRQFHQAILTGARESLGFNDEYGDESEFEYYDGESEHESNINSESD
ncbi:tau 95 subunit of transcription factor TFIIIC [Entomophthora muscae]|uniref:Tau 95 subunit of transcription factor TFIIIC n=2 Tax=Entomophthora muscae TaxID=34485 RepID=A0ACC2TP01_9FUNG|nr:tau 95 subunit of transcription factor TFIIIC [Entomophthora muscae]